MHTVSEVAADPMSPEDQRVSVREFSKAMDDIRSLMVQLDSARAEASRMRHETIGNTLQRIMNEQSGMRGDLRAHCEEDDTVEKRVTLIEEWQKRLVWIVLAVIPSSIAVWEGVKKVFH